MLENRSFLPRFSRSYSQSFWLLGPKGTGKSSWLRIHFPTALWIDLRDPERLLFYRARPERLLETIQVSPQKRVIVDEIQKLPSLLPFISASLAEEGRQWILSASSTYRLNRKETTLFKNPMPVRKLHPFMASELGEFFDFNKALSQGLLPCIWFSSNPAVQLQAYCAAFLKEEIQVEGLVRDVGNFARFLEVISLSHAAILNTTEIARDCAVSRTTIDTYLFILQELLIGFTLPIFSKPTRRALSRHPKFYFFDTGIFNAISFRNPKEHLGEWNKQVLEGFVAQHLRAWADAQTERYTLSFWRTRSGLEVDFIIYGPGVFWAIEVKNSQKLSLKDTHSLEAFRQEHPESRQLLIYRGSERCVLKGILCISCEEFIRNIHPDQPLISTKGNKE